MTEEMWDVGKSLYRISNLTRLTSAKNVKVGILLLQP
jgi:hypothetical protein